MPAHNVNTCALADVVKAAKEMLLVKKLHGIETRDEDGVDLSTSIFMLERVLREAKPEPLRVILPDERDH
jgi:hypothetical protein